MSNQLPSRAKSDYAKHSRRSIRLKDYDYSWVGWYFVTICTHRRECILGEIVDDRMVVNSSGAIVNEEWLRTPQIRPQVDLDAFVIMPNHIHGIIIIGESGNKETVGTHSCASLRGLTRIPRSLSSFVAGFKSIATKRINITRNTPGQPVWQSRFYDHVIRNDNDLHRIRKYIANNPLRWALDEDNPVNCQGNR